MIHRIFSSLATFKALTFNPGLNLFVADKSPGATDRQTRNSAGKTSLIEIIHFLLGSECKPDSIFRGKSLEDESFSMGFDLKENQTTVTRKGSNAKEVVLEGDESEWPVHSKIDKESGERILSNKNWNRLLGNRMFGLAMEEESFGASFRSIISYFVRRESSGGFHSASQQAIQQQNWDVQVNLSCLLGLDWEVSRSLHHVRLKEKTLETLRKSSKNGVLGSLVGKAGELRTRLTVTEAKAKKLRDELHDFKVLPEYEDLEKEASRIANELSALTNQNALDRERAEVLSTQLVDEPVPQLPDIQEMYREANIILPELVIKRFDDVEKFHSAVIRNRKSHLRGEIDSCEIRIESRSRKKQQLDKRRREILTTLASHGAIDQMIRLQTELSRQQAIVEELKKRLELAHQIESTDTELKIERAQVRQQLSNDIEDHSESIAEAIVAFEEFSQRISDHEGSLTIDVTDNGPKFSIQVEGGRSKGIRNMQIFCFDMMLAVLWSRRNSGPGFLIHDSHLFDGMDSRQVAKAIEIGSEQSVMCGFQYIITLNSDVLNSAEFSDNFDPTPFINAVRLSDATETGGLFGMRI